MGAVAAAFMLMLATHANSGAFSMTAMATFASKAECQRAAGVVKAALGTAGGSGTDYVCLTESDVEGLMKSSR
jgi:hypothetical protein